MMTSADIKRLAAEAGFDLCGVCAPEPVAGVVEQLRDWLSAGYHADMQWMSDSLERRSDPRGLMDDVRSVIMLAVNYYQPNSEQLPDGHGRIARFARGRDYHKVMARMVEDLLRRFELAVDQDSIRQDRPQFKWWVDFGPFMERAYAQKAGLGFIGKNGMIINQRFGSWILLAEIVTTLKLEPDAAQKKGALGACGDCRRCLDACPGQAIVVEGVVDSRRCLSYHTIENRGDIPEEFHTAIGNRILGCDVCQEVCPLNDNAIPTTNKGLLPPAGMGESLDLQGILDLKDREEFLQLTAGTSLVRPQLEGLQRNARIALTNLRRRG